MLNIIPDISLNVSFSTNKTDAIPDILCKVALNTKNTGHHVIRYT